MNAAFERNGGDLKNISIQFLPNFYDTLSK